MPEIVVSSVKSATFDKAEVPLHHTRALRRDGPPGTPAAVATTESCGLWASPPATPAARWNGPATSPAKQRNHIKAVTNPPGWNRSPHHEGDQTEEVVQAPNTNGHSQGLSRQDVRLELQRFLDGGLHIALEHLRQDIHADMLSMWHRRRLHQTNNSGPKKVHNPADAGNTSADVLDAALQIDQVADRHRNNASLQHAIQLAHHQNAAARAHQNAMARAQENHAAPNRKMGWTDERKSTNSENAKSPSSSRPKAPSTDAPPMQESGKPVGEISIVEAFDTEDHSSEQNGHSAETRFASAIPVAQKISAPRGGTEVMTEASTIIQDFMPLKQRIHGPAHDGLEKIVTLFGDGVKKMGRTRQLEEDADLLDWRSRKSGPSKYFTQSYIKRAVDSPAFDCCSGLVTAASALWIGIQADILAREETDVLPSGMVIGELLFCIFFVGELGLRMVAFGLRIFIRPGWPWAIFDCVVVSLQVVEFITTTISSGASGEIDMSFMRLMRILRLVRVLRVVRIMRFLTELRTIVISILGSLRSLLWTMTLLSLLIYLVGIYFTQLVNDHLLKRKDETLMQAEEDMKVCYENLPKSMFTLFQAMSGGIDWDSCASPLITHIHWVQGIIFVIYIAATVLALMNVVTGVFVEEALKSATREDSACLSEHLKGFFLLRDKEKVGTLPSKIFLQICMEKDFVRYIKSIDIDPDEALALFHLMALGGRDGQINYVEYVNGCLRLRTNAKAIDILSLLHGTRVMSRNLTDNFADVQCLLEEVLDRLARREEDKSQAVIRISSSESDYSNGIGRHGSKGSTQGASFDSRFDEPVLQNLEDTN